MLSNVVSEILEEPAMEAFFDKLHEEQPGVYGFYNN